MKINKLLIYLFAVTVLIIVGGHINANADSKQDNTSSQNTIMSENNGSNNIDFPDASNKTEQVENYVRSISNRLNSTKLELKDAKKQLSDPKPKKAKNIAIKRINKINTKLAKLNDSKEIILNDARQAIESAEKKAKKAKTDEEHINANVSLNRLKISYSELNKVLK